MNSHTASFATGGQARKLTNPGLEDAIPLGLVFQILEC
jgi:hypothetical protein